MPLRLKKILGSLFICVFVLFWIWLVIGASYYVPKNKVAELLYYAIAGMGWCLPVMPILAWMEYGKKRPR